MRNIIPVTLALALVATTAAAQAPAEKPLMQNNERARSGTTPPAVDNPNNASKTMAAPVAGRNSFTEGEAKSRIEKHGYSNVMGLKKDANSIWHAQASQGGKSVNVALDYQGNVTAE